MPEGRRGKRGQREEKESYLEPKCSSPSAHDRQVFVGQQTVQATTAPGKHPIFFTSTEAQPTTYTPNEKKPPQLPLPSSFPPLLVSADVPASSIPPRKKPPPNQARTKPPSSHLSHGTKQGTNLVPALSHNFPTSTSVCNAT